MKYIIYTISMIAFVLVSAMTGNEIMAQVDDNLSQPQDQYMIMTLKLTDKNGTQTESSIMMMQRGNDRRIGKFLSPPDQKGIGFLSLPNNEMYIYLPAYKQIKSISGNTKGGSFANTDFTYEDMEAIEYTVKFDAELIDSTADSYTVKLVPKDDSDYKYQMMTIEKEHMAVTKIEFFKNKETPVKTMTRSDFETVDGYYTARKIKMVDHISNHSTVMEIGDCEFDTDIENDVFTTGFLKE